MNTFQNVNKNILERPLMSSNIKEVGSKYGRKKKKIKGKKKKQLKGNIREKKKNKKDSIRRSRHAGSARCGVKGYIRGI